MVKALQSHNNPGKQESSTGQRVTRARAAESLQANMLGDLTAITNRKPATGELHPSYKLPPEVYLATEDSIGLDLEDPWILYNELETPSWNPETQTFEKPKPNEKYNPFNKNFRLRTTDKCYKKFRKSEQQINLGYYEVPSAYLGYKPGKAPPFYLHQIDAPREFLINKASVSDPDTLTWDGVMLEPESEIKKWMEAADIEIKALEQKQAWEEVEIQKATTKVIPGTWVFRRKRAPNGDITKYKARWVIRGDLQEAVLDTYAPVVSWTTVRIFLVMALVLGWTMKALDFDNAFIQATMTDNVFAHLPRGYKSMVEAKTGRKMCLRLKKSLYGLAIAPKLWYEHLLKGLKELGFEHSSYDRCLLYKEGCLLITFVDDCGLAVKNDDDIDWFVDELRKKGFELKIEGDFDAFLGVAIDKQDDGTIHMHQKGLIKKIIKAAKMEDCNPN